MPVKTLALGFALAACLPVTRAQEPAASPDIAPAPEAPAFGFASREIYKFSGGIHALRTGDFNGDGLGDLVFIDDRRSRIDFLERLPAEAPAAVDASLASDKPNQVEYDGRFAIVHLPVERRVQQLTTGDWNGDSLTDVAWVTQGGQLTVRWSTANSEGRLERRMVDELRGGCVLLESGDHDADGVPDLLACGTSKLVLFPGPGSAKSGSSTLGTGRVVDIVEQGLDSLDLHDLDGDGTRDLLYTYLGSDFPFRYRLGHTDGSFGPRIDVDRPQIRSITVRDLDGDGASEAAVVFRLSGRLSLLGFADLDAGERALRRYALSPGAEREARTFAVGDLDGDGAAEIIVTQPNTSEVVVFSGVPGSRQLRSTEYPSLVGVEHPRLGDTDGDGAAELVVMSAAEHMLGVARPGAHAQDAPATALPFPHTLALDAQPCALDLADMDGDGADDAVLITVSGEGRNREFRIELWHGGPDGLGGPPDVHVIEDMKKEPTALRVRDLDRDGLLDLVVFMPGERAPPVLLFQRAEGFRADTRGEDTPGLGVLVGAAPHSISFADVDGDGAPELLAAHKNFARALTLAADDEARTTPTVVAQYPGPTPDSAIDACALADLDGDGRDELVLRDGHTRELLVYELDAAQAPGSGNASTMGVLLARVAAGRLELKGLEVADLDGDGREDLVLLGIDQLGLVFGGATEGTLTERASFDPPLAETILDQLTTGDLNADGTLDLLVTELSRNALVVVSTADDELQRALGFKVFERSALAKEGITREPRELLCTDVNGDQRQDVVLLVHDKLIIYLQD